MTNNNQDKTLVVFDTNKLIKSLEGENDYSVFDPKGDIKRLQDFIQKHNLQEKILIGLPEIVLKEYCKKRKDDFEAKLSKTKYFLSKIKNLHVCDVDNISLPQEDFDYESHISNKVYEKVRDPKESVTLVPLKKEDYFNIFEKVLNKAVNHEKPFQEKGDKGFKDAIIFETLKNFQKKNEYAKVILFTDNVEDFSGSVPEDFSKHTGNFLDIESNYQMLEQELYDVYHIIIDHSEVFKYLKTEYFEDELKKFLKEVLGFKIEEDFKIIDFCKGLRNMNFEDYTDLELEDEFPENIIESSVIINQEFQNDNRIYNSTIVFEKNTNNIIYIKFEKIENEK